MPAAGGAGQSPQVHIRHQRVAAAVRRCRAARAVGLGALGRRAPGARRPLARYTDATPAREQLDAVLPAVRRNGWAVSRGELHPGSLSVAVPVFHHGEAVCSLDVAGPAARCDTREWITSAHETLLTSAAELGDSLHTWAPKAPTAPAPHPDSPDRRRPDEVTTHDS
ncbi:IclR family transcriptional regulator C-terminal domain-containing protein [Streptomyces aureus]